MASTAPSARDQDVFGQRATGTSALDRGRLERYAKSEDNTGFVITMITVLPSSGLWVTPRGLFGAERSAPRPVGGPQTAGPPHNSG